MTVRGASSPNVSRLKGTGGALRERDCGSAGPLTRPGTSSFATRTLSPEHEVRDIARVPDVGEKPELIAVKIELLDVDQCPSANEGRRAVAISLPHKADDVGWCPGSVLSLGLSEDDKDGSLKEGGR